MLGRACRGSGPAGGEGGGKEPLASLSSGPRRVWGGVLDCAASEGVQGSGSKGSREGALARPRQVGKSSGLSAPRAEVGGMSRWPAQLSLGIRLGPAPPRPPRAPLRE